MSTEHITEGELAPEIIARDIYSEACYCLELVREDWTLPAIPPKCLPCQTRDAICVAIKRERREVQRLLAQHESDKEQLLQANKTGAALILENEALRGEPDASMARAALAELKK